MLKLSKSLINRPVLSLRTGTMIARALSPIINPNNLKIEGFYCADSVNKKRLILLYQDIRDVIPQGFVVNDHDSLSEPEDLVRLRDVMSLNFELLGKQVVAGGQKLGKVSDFATEVTTMYIQKLYVSQSLLKSFTGGSLSVDRTQILEITNKRIIISDVSGKVPAHAAAAA